jgi:hypothetical protein
VEVDADRQRLGHAAEMRIGLDLAEAPGYWGVLSFLPGEELRSLLLGAGYRLAGYEHVADTGTADPLLREWIRSSHPVSSGGAQQTVLAACWDAALAGTLVQHLTSARSRFAALISFTCAAICEARGGRLPSAD